MLHTPRDFVDQKVQEKESPSPKEEEKKERKKGYTIA